MAKKTEEAGQPLIEAFNWERRLDRGMDELIGLCRGVLADGHLVVEEVRFMKDWLCRNDPVSQSYFGKQLCCRLDKILANDFLDAAEEDELVQFLMCFTGGTPCEPEAASGSCKSCFDDPMPLVRFADKSFCFTGKFEFGSRKACQETVTDLGANVHQYPTQFTAYLVVGETGSRDWIHSSSGRKIEKAIQIREGGHGLSIISEKHWCDALDD